MDAYASVQLVGWWTNQTVRQEYMLGAEALGGSYAGRAVRGMQSPSSFGTRNQVPARRTRDGLKLALADALPVIGIAQPPKRMPGFRLAPA
jgi:hypothetical protein